ncbi:MAG: macrolide ABC transporter permease, partial [Gemmatimonadetes bacterium]|nr:macrolide ABC transporter permease [Gemmatimonadota bacterium]
GQFLGELLVMTTVAMVAGTAVIVQFELFDNLVGRASGEVYLYSLSVALAVIYGLIVLCGLYPSWMATRVQPVEALHYE